MPGTITIRCPRCGVAWTFIRPDGESMEIEAYDPYCWAFVLQAQQRVRS